MDLRGFRTVTTAQMRIRFPGHCFTARAGHELHTFACEPRGRSGYPSQKAMSVPKARACTILAEFGQAQAQTELVGKAVVLTDGKAGTVDKIWLDEFHGLRISVRGFEGKWPVSTIRLTQTDFGAQRNRPDSQQDRMQPPTPSLADVGSK